MKINKISHTYKKFAKNVAIMIKLTIESIM